MRKLVTFQQTDPRLASARLRSLVPMRELERRGWSAGRGGVIVLAKHGWTWTDTIRRAYAAVVFDVCDDHFDTAAFGAHYVHCCRMADVVTCNSEAMRMRILECTGRQAVVIDDPYEDDECKASCAGSGVLWFGSRKSLLELLPLMDAIAHPMVIVSDYRADWCVPWSRETVAAGLASCRCVLVPPGAATRSANRGVTAIRAGRFVVAGSIQAYRDIPGIWVGDDIHAGLDMAMSEDTTDRIRQAQAYVRDRYAPERIAEQWDRVLTPLCA